MLWVQESRFSRETKLIGCPRACASVHIYTHLRMDRWVLRSWFRGILSTGKSEIQSADDTTGLSHDSCILEAEIFR